LSPDSDSERILKIGQDLVKLFDIQKIVPFFWPTLYVLLSLSAFSHFSWNSK